MDLLFIEMGKTAEEHIWGQSQEIQIKMSQVGRKVFSKQDGSGRNYGGKY